MGDQRRTASSARRSSSAASAFGSAGRKSRSDTSARAWVAAIPTWMPSEAAASQAATTSSRRPTFPTSASGTLAVAGRAAIMAARVTVAALYGWLAASDRRPSSRMGGCACTGSAAICPATSALVGDCARAQRAPGRHPPPLGTEHSPGSSSTGSGSAGRSGRGVACRSSRLSRSMAKCGRNSETTRLIAPLHDQ